MNNAINSLNSNTQLSAEEKRRIVEEEAKTLEAFKVTFYAHIVLALFYYFTCLKKFFFVIFIL